MAGLFRLLLALNVVVCHLVPSSRVYHWGPYAVYSFYLLSGYLMTMVLQRTYGFSLAGGGRFALNRVLRLFPTYYGVCLFTLLLLAVFGSAVPAFHVSMRVPDTWERTMANALILPHLWWPGVRLVPPTWSLAVELGCYGLLWLWVARSWRLAWLTVAASAAYTGYLIATQASFPVRYGTFAVSLLPFSLGATAYLGRDWLLAWCSGRTRLVVVGLYAANLFAAPSLYPGGPLLWPFYVNVVLTYFVTPFALDVRLPTKWLQLMDDWAGRLTYPVFLAHYSVAFLVHQTIGGPSRSVLLCLATLPPLFGLSYLLCRHVESPLERWRQRVRSGPAVAAIPGGTVVVGRKAA